MIDYSNIGDFMYMSDKALENLTEQEKEEMKNEYCKWINGITNSVIEKTKKQVFGE